MITSIPRTCFRKSWSSLQKNPYRFLPDEWVIENRNSNHVGSHAIMFYRHLESGILRLRIRKPHTSHPSPKHPYQPQAGLYMYMHSSEFLGDWGGIINAVDRHREIGSGFVSCSCRACERAGEAKLCGRVRGECLSTLGFRMVRCTSAVVCLRFGFCLLCYLHGFVSFS